jgi:DNA-nicking Smr family endonuclease
MPDNAAMKSRSLKDLQQIQRELAAVAEREALVAAKRREAERVARAERNLFSLAVGAVKPVTGPQRVALAPGRPLPVPTQRQLDEQSALQETISDDFDAATLLDTDGELSFSRPGVGPDVTRKLRRGDWSVQRELDLHGLRTEAAREALGAFIREARRHGIRCVRVVHGKGLGSPGKAPVLKSKVHSWLIQKSEVLAFVQAKPMHGGAGALVVLLNPAQG